MICVANDTVVVEAPAPHGEAPVDPDAVPPLEVEPPEPVPLEVPDMAPDEVPVPPAFEPDTELPEPEPDSDPLPEVLEPLEQPAAEKMVARVAKERMTEVAPRIETVLSRVP